MKPDGAAAPPCHHTREVVSRAARGADDHNIAVARTSLEPFRGLAKTPGSVRRFDDA
jgi:hypothetical protein